MQPVRAWPEPARGSRGPPRAGRRSARDRQVDPPLGRRRLLRGSSRDLQPRDEERALHLALELAQEHHGLEVVTLDQQRLRDGDHLRRLAGRRLTGCDLLRHLAHSGLAGARLPAGSQVLGDPGGHALERHARGGGHRVQVAQELGGVGGRRHLAQDLGQLSLALRELDELRAELGDLDAQPSFWLCADRFCSSRSTASSRRGPIRAT
jgi:hypothetical protein